MDVVKQYDNSCCSNEDMDLNSMKDCIDYVEKYHFVMRTRHAI